jgi:hypothetical protein
MTYSRRRRTHGAHNHSTRSRAGDSCHTTSARRGGPSRHPYNAPRRSAKWSRQNNHTNAGGSTSSLAACSSAASLACPSSVSGTPPTLGEP